MPAAAKARPPIPTELQCQHCTHHTDNVVSLEAHVSMAHKDVSARNPEDRPCIFAGCVATWAHVHGGLPGGYTNPEDPEGPPIYFTGDDPAGLGAVRDRNGGLLSTTSLSAAPAAPSPSAAGAATTLVDLPLDLVDVGDNVRVDVAELEELAASIREHGVLQPVKATGPHADGRYLVLWGQRRTLASRLAGRETVPAILLPPDADVDAHGAARSIEQLVENLHRADLNPVDRARAMRAVVDAGTSQADLARQLGISPATVSNDLRLLDTTPTVIKLLEAGTLTTAHAKAIASLPGKKQTELAQRAVDRAWSASELEAQAKWARDEIKRQEKDAERLAKVAKSAIAQLEKCAGKDHLVGVAEGPVRKAVEAAGWTNVWEGDYWSLPAVSDDCGCRAWRVDYNAWDASERARVQPACSSDEHKAERKRREEEEREQRRALEAEASMGYEARRAAVRDELARQLAASGIPVPLLRVLERAVKSYTTQHPQDHELAYAIAEGAVANWQVREMVTPELLAELGIEAAS